MKHEIAGDPISGLKWTKKTTRKICSELKKLGINVSLNTVGRLLKQMGFSLRVNYKKMESGNKNPPDPKDRDKQFKYIKKQRERFSGNDNPVISVDTKKKELIGNFKNSGKSWEQNPVLVKDHDFPSDSEGSAIPYGIYDIQKNQGFVYLGTTKDTPSFAVDSISKWWRDAGKRLYPSASELLILADGGGSNSSRSRVWKYKIGEKLCNQHDLTVTVCHYPPGSSKWNPIEHRLFSEISKNWAGKPLDSYETSINYIKTTKTSSGLIVKAKLVKKIYKKGVKVSDQQMKELSAVNHKIMPKWNYTISPTKM